MPARMGRCPEALERIARALDGVEGLDRESAASIYSDAAYAHHLCGEADRAADRLAAALRLPITRATLTGVSEVNVPFLYSVDQGEPLGRVFEGLGEVDTWWRA